MYDWVRKLVGLPPAQQLELIELEEPSLEERLDRLSRKLGGYSKKDKDELDEIIKDLNVVLDIVEKLISKLEIVADDERARNLRKKLLNNRTRAEKARVA